MLPPQPGGRPNPKSLTGPTGGKSELAIILDACVLLHMRDPAEFYAMPSDLQTLWYEHALNAWTGAYMTRKDGPQSSKDAMAIQAEAIERAQGRAG